MDPQANSRASSQVRLPHASAANTCLPLQGTQGTGVQSPGREDPLEEAMATHSSILAWRTPRTEDPGGLQSVGLQRAGHD